MDIKQNRHAEPLEQGFKAGSDVRMPGTMGPCEPVFEGFCTESVAPDVAAPKHSPRHNPESPANLGRRKRHDAFGSRHKARIEFAFTAIEINPDAGNFRNQCCVACTDCTLDQKVGKPVLQSSQLRDWKP